MINISELKNPKKAQPFLLLWILKNYENKDSSGKVKNYFSQQELTNILNDMLCDVGYSAERKSVGRDLNMLAKFGYNIHGVGYEADEDGNVVSTRGKIWLEGDISDKELALMVNEARFNVYLNAQQKRDIISKLTKLGSKEFKKALKTHLDNGVSVHFRRNVDLFASRTDMTRYVHRRAIVFIPIYITIF